MRIFQTITASANPSVSANITWYRNLYEPLIDMRHDVLLFYSNDGKKAMQRKSPKLRGAFSQRLLDNFMKEHEKKPFDLFFAYLMDGMIDPGAIDQIRKTGVPTCNFSCNNAHQFYLVDELSPHFDYNLHSEKDTRGKFLEIGANAIWWPMASNPKYFKPLNLPRTIPVSFVGANYGLRARYIMHLLEEGIDVHAYGPGWVWGARSRARSVVKRYLYLLKALCEFSVKGQSLASAYLADHDFSRMLTARFPSNVHLPVSDEELIALYSRSHITLGFLEVHDKHNPNGPVRQHVHLREFEAPMSGALYCTGYTDELAEMFEPDKEVVTYRSQHELADKVEFYLENQPEAEKIRRAGRERALRDHTYHRRFKALFKLIGLAGS
jgi:spore maturation protein CgeB